MPTYQRFFAFIAPLSVLVACSGGSSTSPDTSADGGAPGTGNDAAATTDPDGGGSEAAAPIAKGIWQHVTLPTTADATAVYAPSDGTAFVGTTDGMYRFDGTKFAKVDLGCTCTIADIDRNSGLALGMDGGNVYAGVYDGKTGYTPFAWQTSRGGPAPRRGVGDATGFVYSPVGGGWTVRYDPTAIAGSPSFGSEPEGGDLLANQDDTIAVWGTPSFYWVAAGTGMYDHSDNFYKVTPGDVLFLDVWGTASGDIWALSSSVNPALWVYDGSNWVQQISIAPTAASGGPIRFWMVSSSTAWVISQVLGDPSPTASSVGYVTGIAGGTTTWIPFPTTTILSALALSKSDVWAVGTKGTVYRCVEPGCNKAASAPLQ